VSAYDFFGKDITNTRISVSTANPGAIKITDWRQSKKALLNAWMRLNQTIADKIANTDFVGGAKKFFGDLQGKVSSGIAMTLSLIEQLWVRVQDAISRHRPNLQIFG
jgi:hypothetical protein